MMTEFSTKDEIMQAFQNGKISEGEVWNLLKKLKPVKQQEEKKLHEKSDLPKEHLNKYEIEIIERFQSVRFGSARGAARFTRDIRNSTELTPRQKEYLRLLTHRYRRQLFRIGDPDLSAKSFIEKMKGKLNV